MGYLVKYTKTKAIQQAKGNHYAIQVEAYLAGVQAVAVVETQSYPPSPDPTKLRLTGEDQKDAGRHPTGEIAPARIALRRLCTGNGKTT